MRRVPLLSLEVATLLSGTANGMVVVILPWLILERTGSASAAGAVAAATAIPLLGSSLFAGTLVDRFGRRRCAIISDLSSGLAVAAIPLVDEAFGLGIVTLAALAMLGAVFDPAGVTAREAMLPGAASRAGWRLDRINAVHEAVWGVAYLVGPGVGGLLIGAIGATDALWVTAGCFALSSLLLVAVRVPGAGRPADPAERAAGIWQATREGVAFVWNDRLLRTMGLLALVLIAVYLPVEGVILPVYFEEQGAPERLGVVIMAMSGGAVAGALLYGALAPRLPRRPTFLVAMLGTSLALLAMGPLPPYVLLVVLAAIVGVAFGPFQPLLNLAMQTRTPERLRGRVIGLLTNGTYAAGPLGYLVAGPLVQAVGVRPAFIAIGIVLTALSLAAIPLRSLRDLDDTPATISDAEPEPVTLPERPYTY
jgi:MFS family permease